MSRLEEKKHEINYDIPIDGLYYVIMELANSIDNHSKLLFYFHKKGSDVSQPISKLDVFFDDKNVQKYSLNADKVYSDTAKKDNFNAFKVRPNNNNHDYNIATRYKPLIKNKTNNYYIRKLNYENVNSTLDSSNRKILVRLLKNLKNNDDYNKIISEIERKKIDKLLTELQTNKHQDPSEQYQYEKDDFVVVFNEENNKYFYAKIKNIDGTEILVKNKLVQSENIRHIDAFQIGNLVVEKKIFGSKPVKEIVKIQLEDSKTTDSKTTDNKTKDNKKVYTCKNIDEEDTKKFFKNEIEHYDKEYVRPSKGLYYVIENDHIIRLICFDDNSISSFSDKKFIKYYYNQNYKNKNFIFNVNKIEKSVTLTSFKKSKNSKNSYDIYVNRLQKNETLVKIDFNNLTKQDKKNLKFFIDLLKNNNSLHKFSDFCLGLKNKSSFKNKFGQTREMVSDFFKKENKLFENQAKKIKANILLKEHKNYIISSREKKTKHNSNNNSTSEISLHVTKLRNFLKNSGENNNKSPFNSIKNGIFSVGTYNPCKWSDLLRCKQFSKEKEEKLIITINELYKKQRGGGCKCKKCLLKIKKHSCKLYNCDNIEDLTFFAEDINNFKSTMVVDGNVFILGAVLSVDKKDNKYITYVTRKSSINNNNFNWYKCKGLSNQQVSRPVLKDGLIYLYTKESKMDQLLDILPKINDISDTLSEIETKNKYFIMSLLQFIITSYSFYYKLDVDIIEKLLEKLKNKSCSRKNIRKSIEKSLPKDNSINFLLYNNLLHETHYSCKKCKKNMYKRNKTNMIYL